MICLTETWCSDETFIENSNLKLPKYNSIHLGRKNKQGGGVCTFVNEALLYKIRTDLSVSNAENETLTIEIINKNAKNIIVSNCYRPPTGKVSSIKKHITHVTDKLIKAVLHTTIF